MNKSYTIIYSGDIADGLTRNNITNFMILNNRLAVVYEDELFDENVMATIPQVSYYAREEEMSSLINITNRLDIGETVSEASQINYINKNPYITASGKGILIAIIDSGIDYLHPDFINSDNTSKIVSIWDQSSNKKSPPKGGIFGSEFTREDINRAIKENNDNLTQDEVGTGTIAAGICSGRGNLNPDYSGVAVNSELVVVKLREYEDRFKVGIKNYVDTDFLAAIKYVLNVAEKENKSIIINLTVGSKTSSGNLTTYLDTFTDLSTANTILVSGAGNEGNTDIHYKGNFINESYSDVKIQVGEQKALDISVLGVGPDKIGAMIISPSGELSFRVTYAPDNYMYHGKLNLENTTYNMRITYPYFFTGNQLLRIMLDNIVPGIWTLRLYPEFTISKEFHIYLPNKNLISDDTRFIDPNSFSTITKYGFGENVITVGSYDSKTSSLWVGSSKGNIEDERQIKPDIVAPGVDLISTFINKSYTTSTGTGVSSSLVCGSLAIIMEYVGTQGAFEKSRMTTKVLKTFLMLGAEKQNIYIYPNESYGYGNLDLKSTIEAIANLL